MRFLEWNCIVKWVILFASFCCLWEFLLENLKLIYKLLIIYFLVQVLFFGTVLGHFSQCNFKIFHRCPTMVADIFTQRTLHHPSSTWLCSNSIENNFNSRIISYPSNSLLLWSVIFKLWRSHGFLQGWKPPFSEGAPPPTFFLCTSLFLN